jgi:hypothetical protein
MLPTDDCNDCSAAPLYSRTLNEPPSVIALSLLPFIITFLVVSIGVLYRVFPLLSGQQESKSDDPYHYLPSNAPPELRQAHDAHGAKSVRRRIAGLSFSTTIALATVLVELILCEISNTVNPAARTVALKITIPSLLFLLVVLIPFLELQSIVRSAGWDFTRKTNGKGIPKVPWILQFVGFAAWLTGFWWLGKGLPGRYIEDIKGQDVKSLSDACLERIGVIGISLMALLSGFASISSPWASFSKPPRPVTESDIARKAAGLDATAEMLVAKRSRLRALERKMSDAPQVGFMTKAMNSIRSSGDPAEKSALNLEISGLETMERSLSSSLSLLQARYASQQRASTKLGKAMLLPSYAFSIYCVYRIIATLATTLNRYTNPNPTSAFSTSDPINRVLGMIAKHVDPTLDQAAWSRQISFLLSGVMLLASINPILTTLHLFTRYTPGLLYTAQANAALLVGQVSATYVISSALLLRSNLPREVGTVISEALGSPLDTWFVEGWFEGWFLLGGAGTAVGIWLGRKFGDSGDYGDWDDLGGVEMGMKRN